MRQCQLAQSRRIIDNLYQAVDRAPSEAAVYTGGGDEVRAKSYDGCLNGREMISLGLSLIG